MYICITKWLSVIENVRRSQKGRHSSLLALTLACFSLFKMITLVVQVLCEENVRRWESIKSRSDLINWQWLRIHHSSGKLEVCQISSKFEARRIFLQWIIQVYCLSNNEFFLKFLDYTFDFLGILTILYYSVRFLILL